MFRWNPFKRPEPVKPLTAEQHLAQGTPFNTNNFNPWQGFRNLTPEVIAATSDQDVHRAISNHFQLKELDATRAGERITRHSFTREVLLLHAIWLLDAEVRNGAFTQYFEHQDEQGVRDAIDGLNMIEAQNSLRTLNEAIGVFSHHHDYLLQVVQEYNLSRPSERPETETATHDFRVYQDELDAQRVKFMRSMSATQLAVQ